MSKNTNLSFLTDFITADIVNTRVGINNASPQTTFDVTGTGKFSGILTLGSTISNGTYAYTLPSATGTLALTSDLGNYVTLGTAQTITGEKIFTNSIILKNSSTGLVLSSFSPDRLQIGGVTYASQIIFPATSRTWNLPDATGTIALVGGAGVGTVTSVAAITLGTSGTDLSSTVANGTTTPVITLNVPDASATARGVITTGTQYIAGLKIFTSTIVANVDLQLPAAGTSSTTFIKNINGTGLASFGSNGFGFNNADNIYFSGSNKGGGVFAFSNTGTQIYTLQNASGTLAFTSQIPTNPVGGTGTTNYLSKFTGSTTIGNSLIFDNGTNVLIGTTTTPTPVAGVAFPFSVTSAVATRIRIDSTQATPNSGFGLYANSVQKWSIAMFGTDSDFTIYNDALLSSAILVKGITSNVLIGYGVATADTGFKLDVNGTGRFTGALNGTSATFSTEVTSSGGQGRFGGWATGAGYQGNALEVGVSGGNAFMIGYNRTSGSYIPLSIGGNTNQTTTIGGSSIVFQNNGVTALTIASTGAATFSSSVTTGATINSGDSITMAGELYYGNVTSNRKLRAYSTGIEGSATLNYSFWNGSTWVIKSTLDYNGAATFSSSVTATGLIINNNGEALRAYGLSPNVSFYNSANTVRGGYVNHDGSNMNIVANVGGISLTGAATFNLGSGEMRLNRTGTSEFLKLNTYYLLSDGNDQLLGSVTGATSIYAGNGVSPRLTITSSGNVLIGTTTDNGAKFQLGGFSGAVNQNNGIKLTNNVGTIVGLEVGGSNDSYIGTISASNFSIRTANNPIITVTSGGNVGIGTTTINSERLTVSQTTGNSSALYVYTLGVATGQSYGLTVAAGTNASDRSFAVFNQAGTSEYFKVRGDGIIFAPPIYNNTTATASNITIFGDGSMYRSTASSERFKENITDWIENGLDTILALKPKEFTYKEDYYNFPERKFLGLIAEEVQEVSNYLVDFENEDGSGQVENVRYANIVVPLIKAIQEQQKQIQELKNKLS